MPGEALKTSDQIKKSKWKRGEIRKLLGLHHNKFATKMKYNDWDANEIALLKKNKVID